MIKWIGICSASAIVIAAIVGRLDDGKVMASDRVTFANYERITSGMSKFEVEAILGGAPHYQPGQLKVIGLGGTIQSAIIREQGFVWESLQCRVFITFRNDNRVGGRMFEGHGQW